MFLSFINSRTAIESTFENNPKPGFIDVFLAEEEV